MLYSSWAFLPFIFLFLVSVQISTLFYGVVFLLINYKSFFYMLDKSPLLDICFANIFSHSVISLFILYFVFWRAKVLNFNETKFIKLFFFMVCVLRYLRNCLLFRRGSVFDLGSQQFWTLGHPVGLSSAEISHWPLCRNASGKFHLLLLLPLHIKWSPALNPTLQFLST